MVIAVSDGACKLDSVEKSNILFYTIRANFRAYSAYIGIYFSFIKRFNCDDLSLFWPWWQHIYLRRFAMIFLSELGHKILSSLPSSRDYATQSTYQRGGKEDNFLKSSSTLNANVLLGNRFVVSRLLLKTSGNYLGSYGGFHKIQRMMFLKWNM